VSKIIEMDSLNYINYLNLVGYIVNILITFGAAPVFNFPDNAELSDKYQTLVTPAGFTFAIWAVIFGSQAMFVIFQMLSGNRSNELVQDGVSYWYFVACIFQSAWTFAFGYEVIWFSVFMMLGILVSLVTILVRQKSIISPEDDALKEFALYKFPFSVHCGWIAVAFAVNVNVWITASEAEVDTREYCAYATLIYAILVAAFAFIYFSPPNFTIPSVLVWATIGIASELKRPQDEIEREFEKDTIIQVRGSVIVVCALLAVVTVVYGIYTVIRKKKENNDSERPSTYSLNDMT